MLLPISVLEKCITEKSFYLVKAYISLLKCYIMCGINKLQRNELHTHSVISPGII